MGFNVPTLWWWFPEMSSSFILFAILIGVVGGLGEQGLTDSFVDGARDLLGVALIVGVARGISVVMNNGQITDTVLHLGRGCSERTGRSAFVILLFLLFIPLSFLIPSSSGLATVTMPIMVPLASFAGVSACPGRLVVPVRSGLLALVTPTYAVVMGGLGGCAGPLSGLASSSRCPLVGALGVLCALVLIIASALS